YEDWQERKQQEERERREAAKAAAAAGNSDDSANSASSPEGGTSVGATKVAATQSAGAGIEEVITRAKSQLGVQYAWGGGNAQGPPTGIRDGGVADAHGDWKKVGFDCSGLMSYAFAGLQQIPAYSGYQYTSGQQVPVS